MKYVSRRSSPQGLKIKPLVNRGKPRNDSALEPLGKPTFSEEPRFSSSPTPRLEDDSDGVVRVGGQLQNKQDASNDYIIASKLTSSNYKAPRKYRN